MTAIRPFALAIEQHRLDDLHARLDNARWPEKETVNDWSQGMPLATLRGLVDHWRHGYDWRACEARLNALGQFVTEIDGLDIHFLLVPSPHADALPLVLTHGWPGSVIEFLDVIGPLVDPVLRDGKGKGAHCVHAGQLTRSCRAVITCPLAPRGSLDILPGTTRHPPRERTGHGRHPPGRRAPAQRGPARAGSLGAPL